MSENRIAAVLLDSNRDLEVFDVAFEDRQQADRVKLALEALGCAVGVDRDGRRLLVTCPLAPARLPE
jgi:hypothetical protein